MGIRCTVFGHRWGDPDTEREREEDGTEVVATVREVRTCRRCGAEDVLGSSKEVRSLAADADQSPHEGPASVPEREHEPDPGPDPVDEAVAGDPERDDGVILDEDAAPGSDRGPREWPDRPEREGIEDDTGEPAPWPETAREQDHELEEERFVGADRRTDEPEPVDAPGGADDRPATQPTTADQSTAGDQHPVDDRPPAEEQPGADEPADDGGAEIIEAGEAARDGDEGTEESVDDTPSGDGPSGSDGVEIPRATDDDATDHTTGDGSDDAMGGTAGDESDDAMGSTTGDGSDDAMGGTTADGTGASTGERSAVRDDATSAGGLDDGDRTDDESAAGRPQDDETLLGPDATHRPDDDAEVIEATEPNEQSRATAEAPVDPTGERIATGPDDSGPDDSTIDGGPSLEPTESRSDEEPAPEDVEYYCPECGYVDDSRWPSRRAGDVCPDCQRSYLSERRH